MMSLLECHLLCKSACEENNHCQSGWKKHKDADVGFTCFTLVTLLQVVDTLRNLLPMKHKAIGSGVTFI